MRGPKAESLARPALAAVPGVSLRERRRRGIPFAIAAIVAFPAGLLFDRWVAVRAVRSILPFACLAGYLYFAGKAISALFPGLDRKWRKGRRVAGPGLALFLCLYGSPVRAQQTIFNVPTADVLDRGKLYFENDDLWRSWEPRAAGFTFRGVVGLGSGVEAGVNLGGFSTPGRSQPAATLAVKWRPVQAGEFSVTVGANGLFFLRGATDGRPALQGYAHASYRLPWQTRVSAGGWFASSGYAAAPPTRGALFGLEQPVARHLALIADMYSGRSSIGYTTFGIEPTIGPWTIYAGYSVRNGDSKRNALLIEIGVNP